MRVCPAIKQLTPYKGGKPISELQRELGLDKVIKLASNENPLPISNKVLDAINNANLEINRYPDSNGFELKQAISTHLQINPESIILGNGSNDVLELIARAFVYLPTDEVIFSQYAFVVYPLVTQALGAKSVVTVADNFGHDLPKMLAAINNKTRLIFIANPNNPTGTLLTDEAIYDFLKRVPKTTIVVLDQAYFEYLDAKDNCVKWLNKFANLVITRTFSKAYGLAGLRVGYGLSSSKIADYINRIRQPFNVNNIAQSAAVAAILDKDFLQKSVRNNQQGLLQLSRGFNKLGLEYIPSSANFIALKLNNPNKIYQQLLAKGFITRLVEMPNYIRVSVGLKNENTKFLDALKSLL